MHYSQHLRSVLKIGSKDITQGKIDSHSQSKEDEGSNHHLEGRRANNRNKITGHQCLGDHQSSASAEKPAERVNEEGRQDESNRTGNENERDNCIYNIVMSEFMSMIRTAQLQSERTYFSIYGINAPGAESPNPFAKFSKQTDTIPNLFAGGLEKLCRASMPSGSAIGLDVLPSSNGERGV